MVRQTSIEAYNAIKNSGLLGPMQWRVYDALYKHGPCTGAELFYRMNINRNPTHSNVTTRLGELRDEYDVVRELPKRRCTRSPIGAIVIVWDVTDRVPIKRNKPKKTRCHHCGGKGFFFEPTQESFL